MGFSQVWRLLVLAGRRCRCLGWHGDLLIVHHHWQHCFSCARSCSKFPIARWDFHMFCALCLQGGGVYIHSGTVTFLSCTITGNIATSVHARAQNFPSPQWENGLRACLDSRLRNCERFGQLQWVRATETLKTSHRPKGKMAYALASTLACTTAADASIN